jgi:hypothetical protein
MLWRDVGMEHVPNRAENIEMVKKGGTEMAKIVGTFVATIIAGEVLGALLGPALEGTIFGEILGIGGNAAKIEGAAGRSTSQIIKNADQGKQFESVVIDNLKSSGQKNVVEQVTIKAENGVKTRLDVASKDSNGKVVLTEAKSSSTAPLTKNQKIAYPSIEQNGGVVVGKGKPGFTGGSKIPATKVDIVRPNGKN